MNDSVRLNQLLSEIARYAAETFGAQLESVILYGSYARNEADSESDVDVMVLVDAPKEELAKLRYPWNHFGTELDLKYGVLTSVILQDSETFHKWKDVLPFYQNVLKEGVRISA